MRRRAAARWCVASLPVGWTTSAVDGATSGRGRRVIVVVSALDAPRDAGVGVVGCRRLLSATTVRVARWFACEVDPPSTSTSRSPNWMEEDDDDDVDDDDRDDHHHHDYGVDDDHRVTRDAWYRGVRTTLERRQRRPRRARRLPVHPAPNLVSDIYTCECHEVELTGVENHVITATELQDKYVYYILIYQTKV